MTCFRIRIFVAAALLAMLAGCSMSADTKLSEQAVVDFHRMLDAGQIDAIYASTSDDLRKATTHEQFVAFLTNVHEKSGATKSSTEASWHVNYNTTGNFVTLEYTTTYTNTGTSKETFVYRVDGGKALLAGYHVN
jgi:hypothetical protein